ncbi:hypothetical protein [Paenibacillus nasutitermitis]|uniref:Uncharacterized protein n=1 Tax=Paenibacillus nasutitermitis TaxID=1652958 RepID=A0A916YVL5_9BACL|nr:hypothetical protein [Paenibacillus nasutitermitis]GGD63562.1 hypothetical protein GCM10010911_21600 [Paenibacillus nasutitermitis]
MPIVLRHRETGEIACGMLRNIYQFEYYGALWWEDEETAEIRMPQALQAAGYEDERDWDRLDIKEERLKIFNVKLNNDSGRRLILDRDGMIFILKG